MKCIICQRAKLGFCTSFIQMNTVQSKLWLILSLPIILTCFFSVWLSYNLQYFKTVYISNYSHKPFPHFHPPYREQTASQFPTRRVTWPWGRKVMASSSAGCLQPTPALPHQLTTTSSYTALAANGFHSATRSLARPPFSGPVRNSLLKCPVI